MTGHPMIGITCRTHVLTPQSEGTRSRLVFLGQKECVDCILEAGGTPLLLPSIPQNEEYAQRLVETLDGFLLTGGEDSDPLAYGQEPHAKLGLVDHIKGRFESVLLRHALKAKIPVFGICGGHQILNIACGGTLFQDIGTCTGSTMQHTVKLTEPRTGHSVNITPGTRLHSIVETEQLRVNSTHHQAIDQLGEGLVATAHAPDGTIEAIERPGETFVLGVQWHPELLTDREPACKCLFEAFVAACQTRPAGSTRTGRKTTKPRLSVLGA